MIAGDMGDGYRIGTTLANGPVKRKDVKRKARPRGLAYVLRLYVLRSTLPMAQPIRVAILGAGRPGVRHAEGYKAAGGFAVTAVADLIPQRRKAIMDGFGARREAAEAADLVADAEVDAVSV